MGGPNNPITNGLNSSPLDGLTNAFGNGNGKLPGGLSAPTITGTTVGSVAEDSGAIVTGTLTDSGNPLPDTWTINTGATYGTATIDPSTGLWSYDLNDTNAVVDALDAGETLIDTFVVQVEDLLGTDTQVITITINGVPCFTAGTRIDTEFGIRRIEDLNVGDRVWTRDNGLQVVRWIGRRPVTAEEMFANDKLRPVHISKGALGNGLPSRNLVVSRQHRMLIGPKDQAEELLIAAIRLTGWRGVHVAETCQPIEYIHLLFDRHEIVTVEGSPSESLLLAPEALKALSSEAREEIAEIFPQLAHGEMPFGPARIIPENKEQKRFVSENQSLASSI